jgi:hypothetical protein
MSWLVSRNLKPRRLTIRKIKVSNTTTIDAGYYCYWFYHLYIVQSFIVSYYQTTNAKKIMMKLLSNNVLSGGMKSIERVVKNNAVAALALRTASVNSQRLLSSMSEAADMDAHHFGYRFVSPVNARGYTTAMPSPDSVTKTLEFRKEYDEYDEIMRCPIRHTLGAVETTNFPSMVPSGAVFDVLEAHREWDSAVKDGTFASITQDQSDDPYYSDCEEMGDNWDIEFGVDEDLSHD